MARHDDDEIPTLHKPPPRVVIATGHRQLRCALTAEEHRAQGVRLSALLASRADLIETHKEVRAQQKSDLADIDDKINEIRVNVELQSEPRSVEVEEIADYDKGLVEVSRIDTGEIVATRPLTNEDRQRRLM